MSLYYVIINRCRKTTRGAAHRRFGVDNPILGKERVDEGLKPPRIGERGSCHRRQVGCGDRLGAILYKPLAEDPSEGDCPENQTPLFAEKEGDGNAGIMSEDQGQILSRIRRDGVGRRRLKGSTLAAPWWLP
jgi:hypothetical protein